MYIQCTHLQRYLREFGIIANTIYSLSQNMITRAILSALLTEIWQQTHKSKEKIVNLEKLLLKIQENLHAHLYIIDNYV